MIIQDIYIETSELDPFGEVKSASIEVRARVKTGIVTIGRLGLHRPFIFFDSKIGRYGWPEFLGHFYSDDLHQWKAFQEAAETGDRLHQYDDSLSTTSPRSNEESAEAISLNAAPSGRNMESPSKRPPSRLSLGTK